MKRTLEECIREIEDASAMLRHFGDAAALHAEPPDRHTLSGLADVCGELQSIAHSIRKSLKGRKANLPIKLKRR